MSASFLVAALSATSAATAGGARLSATSSAATTGGSRDWTALRRDVIKAIWPSGELPTAATPASVVATPRGS